MIDVNLDFSGLQDIARDLQTLSKAENNKVLRDSTRAGAEVLRQEVIDRAPEQTGKLKKNVVVVTQKSRRRGEISSGVHIRGVNPRTGNSDNTMKASNKRNAFTGASWSWEHLRRRHIRLFVLRLIPAGRSCAGSNAPNEQGD
jgi:HK97 gp10 family phage protein